MNDGLIDAFRYNAWATRELLRFLQHTPVVGLTTSTVGSYGSILDTLNHMLSSETYYFWFLSDRRLSWEWELDGDASIPQLQRSADDIEAGWQEFLAIPFDAAQMVSRPSASTGVRTERAGIVLTQALHHGNVHREQVNMILTGQGMDPPDLDVWMFNRAQHPRSA